MIRTEWTPDSILPNVLILYGVSADEIRSIFTEFPEDRTVHFIVVSSPLETQQEVEFIGQKNLSPLVTSYVEDYNQEIIDELASSSFEGMAKPHDVKYYFGSLGSRPHDS